MKNPLHKALPRVLVGIVTFNRVDLLAKAIASAIGQSFPNCRVAVIDDCSTDSTAEISAAFPEVQWKCQKRNSGYLIARNEFMSTQECEYFLSLDDDAWFLVGDEIALAVDYLEAHPDTGAIAFDILTPERDLEVPRAEPQQVNMFIGCGHVVRLSTVQKLGLYDPLPGFYGGEEKDLCLRMLDAGFKVILLPGVHVWHEKSPVARDLQAQNASGVCNDLAFALRRTPAMWLIPILAMKLISHLLFGMRMGLLRSSLKGIRLFLVNIIDLWPTRRPVGMKALLRYRQLSRSAR